MLGATDGAVVDGGLAERRWLRGSATAVASAKGDTVAFRAGR